MADDALTLKYVCIYAEVGVSDGEKRTLPAGTVLFLKETGSKGHTTRVIGGEQLTIVVTEVS